MFSRRWVQDDDFEMLNKWWKENRFTAPHPTMLPQNGRGGIIVTKDNVPLCAGFLYKTDSIVVLLEYVVMDFQIKDRKLRKEALTFLISELGNIAKANGKPVIFTSVINPNLIGLFVELGYNVGDRKATNLIKIV